MAAGGPRLSKTTSVFVDHLPRGISPEWLRDLFSEYGRVEDVFVSKKVRKQCSDAFGFVRFRHEKDAMVAISKLHGYMIKNSKITASMARYDRMGKEIRKKVIRNMEEARDRMAKEGIRFPALRDTRRYAEVVVGHRKSTTPEANAKTQASIKVPVNGTFAERLNRVVVVEILDTMELDKAAALVSKSDLQVVGLAALNATTLILFFESENEANMAIEQNSPLWKLGGSVCRWSEETWINERVVWVECGGIHPKWWSYENMKRLGERWGRVVRVDPVVDGINSLTCARILIKTKAHKRIEECVKVEWESGSCMVSVSEVCNCKCKNGNMLQSKEYGDDDGGTSEGDCEDNGDDTQLMNSYGDQQGEDKSAQEGDSGGESRMGGEDDG